MKKRIIALALAVAMTFSFTACGGNGEAQDNQESQEVAIADATELMTTIWNAYEGEKFAAVGGDYENAVSDAPGKFDYTNQENLDAMLAMPGEGADMIDDAASLMHMMNANSFTAGAFHVTDAENVQALADIMKDSIMNRQWLCGFPEKMLIVSVGEEYVVSAFGLGEVMDHFKTALIDCYGATVIYEENLV